MTTPDLGYQKALEDFSNARRQAAMQDILARLTGQSNELLSFDEVARKLKLSSRTERGVQNIPLNAIVGSVGRYSDFTRTFLPRSESNRQRWARVKSLIDAPDGRGWPPIDVYKVDAVYFVLDGNHRVSVARQEGFETIEANVIEVRTDVPLTPDLKPDDLILKAEYANFLEKTGITKLRPGANLEVTAPGQYQKLLEHIEVHRYFMGLDFQRDISYEEAVAHWYDQVYLPLVEIIRERGVLRWFPGRTETDLYLWISENRAALEANLGWHIRPETAVSALTAQQDARAEDELSDTGQWRLSRMVDRYTESLFHEILVPLSGSPGGWQALEQAILIAEREKADLHGLHVVASKTDLDSPATLAIQEQFNQRCQQAGLSGGLAIQQGRIAGRIVENALLSDLVVLHTAHPPSSGLSGLRSGLRHIIWQAARPILTVPDNVSPLDNAILAYDGSLKAREALFVAAYLAERWQTRLTVVTVSQGTLAPGVQDEAKKYLDLHEVQAEFLFEKGKLDIFPEIITQRGANLVLMGSYGGSVWQEVMLGSLVNLLLQQAACPLLICR